MAVLKLPIAGLLGCCLLAGFSCRSSHNNSSYSIAAKDEYSDAFDSALLDESFLALTENTELGHKLNTESEWLALRLKISSAEIRLQKCKEAELKLKLEMAKYDSLNDEISSSGGFITDRQREIWNARLDIARKDTNIANAKVSLLKRDLDDLNAKLKDKGWGIPRFKIQREITKPSVE